MKVVEQAVKALAAVKLDDHLLATVPAALAAAHAALEVERTLLWQRMQVSRQEELITLLRAEGDRTIRRKPREAQVRCAEGRLARQAVDCGVIPLLLPLLKHQASVEAAANCLLRLVELVWAASHNSVASSLH